MKNLFVVLVLALSPALFAKNKTSTESKRAVASVSGLQKTAVSAIQNLFGKKKGEKINTEVVDEQTFRITIGDGSSQDGSATYLVKFPKHKLEGASDNEVVVSMDITYEAGN